jgi:5-(carboxyamino)imidazole ribonucleotide synthase
VKYIGLTESLAIEGVKIHLYGKKITRGFRKMGHVTIIAPTLEEAIEKSEIIKKLIHVRT